MAKAYMIANLTVTDPERYATYRAGVAPVVEQYGGRFLVRGGAIHKLEGSLELDRFVILEFPSVDAAKQFYASPEYAPLLKLREQAAQSQVAIIEGLPD